MENCCAGDLVRYRGRRGDYGNIEVRDGLRAKCSERMARKRACWAGRTFHDIFYASRVRKDLENVLWRPSLFHAGICGRRTPLCALPLIYLFGGAGGGCRGLVCSRWWRGAAAGRKGRGAASAGDVVWGMDAWRSGRVNECRKLRICGCAAGP